jgi:hypothetical protein
VRSRAHNVILFNGEGQPAEDHRRAVKIPGQVHSMLDGLGLKYVYADATGPMAHFFRRNYRHWLWTGGAILIFDDVLAHEDGRLDWLLHYDGKAEAGGNLVRLTNGAGSAEVRFLFPTELTSREETGLADHEPSRKVPYLVLSAQTAARQQKFVVAIVPGGQAQPPSIEPLSARDALGVRLRHGGEITDVYLNLQADGRRMHENTNNIIEGWDTDAYLFAVTRPEASAEATPDNVTRAFVSSGSYLRKSGQVLLDSLSKVEAVWRPGTTTEVLIEGQDVIEASVRVAARPAALTANGKRATFEYSPRTKLVSFRVGKNWGQSATFRQR